MRSYIDEAARAAMRSYIRTSLAGGMPTKYAKQVMDCVEGAAELGKFSIALAEALTRQGLKIEKGEAVEQLVIVNRYDGNREKTKLSSVERYKIELDDAGRFWFDDEGARRPVDWDAEAGAWVHILGTKL